MINKKVTIYDVAKKINVSTATVNRAINGKPKVSQKMRKLVLKTAEEMGYKASKTAASLSRNQIKIGVIINNKVTEFTNEVYNGASKTLKELQDYRVTGEILTTKDADKKEIEFILRRFIKEKYNGIGIIPPYYETALDDIIEEVKNAGIIVGTAVSDLSTSKRDFSVRSNGIIAGKMAAELLFWLVGKEPVAIVTGFRDSTVHKETIIGFRSFSEKNSMNLVGIYEHRDDPELAYYLASRMMKERPDIKGIYFGSANSLTFCNRLNELGFEKKIKIISSDLLPGIVENIKSGVFNATIFQNPYNQGGLLIKKIYQMIAENSSIDKDVYYLNPQLVMSSNLEEYI